jgi:hypothetical protein
MKDLADEYMKDLADKKLQTLWTLQKHLFYDEIKYFLFFILFLKVYPVN